MCLYEIELNPTSTKSSMLLTTADVHRVMFEYTLNKQIQYYKENKTYLTDNIMLKEVTQLKKQPKYQGLKNINSQVINYAVHLATKHFIHCLNNNIEIKNSKESIKEKHFYLNPNRLNFRWDKKWIWFPRIKHIKFEYYEKLNELKKEGIKFKSSKVFFDVKRKKWILSLVTY